MDARPPKLRVILLSGAVIGALSGIPGLSLINCCCCAWILLGGYLAVYLYRQELSPEMPPLESSEVIILGLTAGVAGAFIGSFLELFITLAFGDVGNQMLRSITERLIEYFESSGSLPGDAAADLRSQMEDAIQQSQGASGFFSGLFSSLIIYPLFSMFGALIGMAVLKKKDRNEHLVSSGGIQ